MNVWMYHKTEGAKLFDKESDAGDGWFDTPAAFEESEPAEGDPLPDEVEEKPKRGRKAK